MTEIEENSKLASLKNSLRSMTISYRRNFNRLAQDALEINMLIKEVLGLEGEKKDEQNDR